MSDEPEVRLALRGGDSSLVLSRARISLAARGRREAAALSLIDPLSETRRRAEQGDAEAQYELGLESCGDFDTLDDERYADGARWFRKAAQQGHAEAQNQLSILYLDAARWETNQGWARSLLQCIATAMQSSDLCVLDNYAEAAKWFRKAAEQGHAPAQFSLGGLHHNGIGVPRDLSEAARWYRKAAERGNPQAQFYLAVLTESGQGVERDHAEAGEWYHRAAEQGHAAAQEKLRASANVTGR